MRFEQVTKNQVSMAVKIFTIKSFLLTACFFTSAIFSYGQSFSMERDFPNQTTLPDSLYKILLRDKDINDTIEESKDSSTTTKALKKQFFQTTRVNLNNDKLPDLVVKAQSLLLGANVTRFWIFKQTSKGYVLVLETVTHSLSILRNKSEGHRNIRCDKLSAVQLFTNYYRFDGDNYVYSWSKTKDL